MKATLTIITILVLGICILCASMYGYTLAAKDEIYPKILQAALTGFFTFIGLFITITNQEKQKKKDQLKEICPCFIVKISDAPGAGEEYNRIKNGNTHIPIIDPPKESENNSIYRKTTIEVFNTKSVWAINFNFIGNIRHRVIEAAGSFRQEVYLPENGRMKVYFEDVYGNAYIQEFILCYKIDTYIIITNQPQRTVKVEGEV